MSARFWRIALPASILAVLILAALLLAALDQVDQMPVHIMVNGIEVDHWLHLDALTAAHKLVLVVGLAALLLLALLLLPVLLLVLMLCVALPLCLVFGIPLMVAALVLAVLLAPPVLLAWGLWRLLRPRPAASAAPAAATTIRA
jgi:hypothetical protein